MVSGVPRATLIGGLGNYFKVGVGGPTWPAVLKLKLKFFTLSRRSYHGDSNARSTQTRSLEINRG